MKAFFSQRDWLPLRVVLLVAFIVLLVSIIVWTLTPAHDGAPSAPGPMEPNPTAAPTAPVEA